MLDRDFVVGAPSRDARVSRAIAVALVTFFSLSPMAQSATPCDVQLDNERRLGKPLLFEVSSNTSKVYLFGTIHYGREERYQLGDAVLQAFNSSSFIAVESDTRDENTVVKAYEARAYYPAGQDLAREISPALMNSVKRLSARYQIREPVAVRLRPLALAYILTTAEEVLAGFRPEWSVDRAMLELIEVQHKPVVELEDVEAVLDLEFGVAAGAQVQLLQQTIAEIDRGLIIPDVCALAAAWQSGDQRRLVLVIREQLASLPKAMRDHEMTVLAKRNAMMKARIEMFIRSGDRYFVAVGMAHLLDDTGIVALLKRDGFHVKKVSP